MLTKRDVIEKALELGFADIGFTTAEPFTSQQGILEERKESYAWTLAGGLDLAGGTDPRKALPEAKAIVVLLESYLEKTCPPALEGHFGRCYLDDDRVTKDGMTGRLRLLREFLRHKGIASAAPFNAPQRLAAARAGLGDFGKNNFLYAHRVAGHSSWVVPLPIIIDREFSPDPPTVAVGCPEWCRNACIAACPTQAIRGPNRLEPRRCIAFLTYFGRGLTPVELREPMGTWVYGCDRCQNVCPRNIPWMARERPINERVAAKAADFNISCLLKMDREFFGSRVRPHMFYMADKDLWRWHMNAARAMGNSRDDRYIPDLAAALSENADERVRAMAAWALGRIGGPAAKKTLEIHLSKEDGLVITEIRSALGHIPL
ncbi:MAG TPA: 4Fe-4S double cluster binding domain-containing protein [Syntrophales bacterium]|nr:4Fe-4S double cluster binding domain-containing protein [Syntrophales bacterium]HPI57459.1 4Fe-4S double cluster binding domain-containing protein [Syntrophales bacterium]HPN25684.1 4Fe-4S double cluster binding domain-containing protein [Syntrophales bacterium]HQM29484.1 4Fe-4S double cluster binding domain-containing protein [Syntrophales bacterium]